MEWKHEIKSWIKKLLLLRVQSHRKKQMRTHCRSNYKFEMRNGKNKSSSWNVRSNHLMSAHLPDEKPWIIVCQPFSPSLMFWLLLVCCSSTSVLKSSMSVSTLALVCCDESVVPSKVSFWTMFIVASEFCTHVPPSRTLAELPVIASKTSVLSMGTNWWVHSLITSCEITPLKRQVPMLSKTRQKREHTR